ncbi:hypothetical protein GH714_009583 [Hevea brasiliensis]|uniref:Uncharacterized protein n=1 Tax=Hevea brasiliensis TaxID=3981 RepID=A0A6A6MZX1_HEVBR|nr:hypothetical protein GH714_009583 [Hevea brasiliensis]
MPVSGNDETAVKSHAGQSSLNIAEKAVHLSSSPAREVQSLPAMENDSLQKEHDSLSQESTPSSASVAGSSCLSDKNKKVCPRIHGERSTQCKMDDVQSNADTANICADRLNWDLNTTMDTWEDSVSDVVVDQVTADGPHMVGVTHDVEPLKLTGMVGTGVATEKNIVESECRSSFSKISSQSGQQYNSEDSLHLRLSPSFHSFNSQEPSSSSANKDSQTAIPNISFPRGLLSAGNTVNPITIKSEPFDDSLKHDSSRTKANPTVQLDFRAVSVKCELVEKFAQDTIKALNFSTEKPVDATPMKSEPFHEGSSETPKTTMGCHTNQISRCHMVRIPEDNPLVQQMNAFYKVRT